MPKQDPNALAQAMKNIAEESELEELHYSPTTGELHATRRNEVVNDPDRVPATRMAREGFFV